MGGRLGVRIAQAELVRARRRSSHARSLSRCETPKRELGLPISPYAPTSLPPLFRRVGCVCLWGAQIRTCVAWPIASFRRSTQFSAPECSTRSRNRSGQSPMCRHVMDLFSRHLETCFCDTPRGWESEYELAAPRDSPNPRRSSAARAAVAIFPVAD